MHPIDALEAQIVRHLLPDRLQTQYAQGDVAHKELAIFVTSIREISARYVSHDVGSKLASPILSSNDAEAYALYYTPINAAKVLHLLPHILPHLPSPDKTISVLDLGCGPGTAGLALLTGLTHSIELTCVEASKPMRLTAQKLLSSVKLVGSVASLSIREALPLALETRFDLIIAANVLAEIPEDEAYRMLTRMRALLTPRGCMLLLEPGQQLHTRRLMQMRDHLLSTDSALAPLFPCLRSDACPMLQASASDWCHGTLEWHQPRLHAQLDKLLGFNKHRIKYSGFVLQRGGSPAEGVRVLTPPQRVPAGIESLVCGAGIYGTIRVAKRNRGQNTRALEKADVFDRLLLSSHQLGELPAEATINKVNR
jgi:ribosomal protein RSM22 (predicted rRNA methylase)